MRIVGPGEQDPADIPGTPEYILKHGASFDLEGDVGVPIGPDGPPPVGTPPPVVTPPPVEDPINIPGTEEWYAEQKRIADEESAARFAPIYEDINALGEMAGEFPTFEEWAATNNVELNGWQGDIDAMQGIGARLAAGPTDADRAGAYADAARMLGYASEEAMNLQMNAWRDDFNPYDEVGMGAQEMDVRRRVNQAQLRDMEARQIRLVQNTYGDTGSTIRMLQTADEALHQINQTQLQQEALLNQEQFERQAAQLASKKSQWQQQLESKQITVAQYMNNIQSWGQAATQAYAQSAMATYNQYQSHLATYGADLNAFIAGIDATYKAISLEMGATVAELDMSAELFDSAVAPHLAALNDQLAQAELNPSWDWGAVILGGALVALAVLFPVLAIPFGTAGAGLIGAGVS